MQLIYRIDHYFFLGECPSWISELPHTEYFYEEAIKLSVKETIKTQWSIEQPWVDLRQKRGRFAFPFSLVKLRVRRKPIFYLLNGVLPLFLVVACSFAQFVMPSESNIGDKLGYIITLLLTTAAFQYSLNGDLPKTPESTMLDVYILYAYAILALFTLEIALVYILRDEGYEEAARWTDFVVGVCFALVWLWRTWRFVYGYWMMQRREVDWEALAQQEMEEWEHDQVGDGKFIRVADGKLMGTYDE